MTQPTAVQMEVSDVHIYVHNETKSFIKGRDGVLSIMISPQSIMGEVHIKYSDTLMRIYKGHPFWFTAKKPVLTPVPNEGKIIT